MGQSGLQGGKCGGEKILGGENFWGGYSWDSKEKLVGLVFGIRETYNIISC